MARIRPVDEGSVETATAELLGSLKKKMGTIPNLISTMANSPAVTRAYLGFSQALAGGTLPRRLAEQIALVVGETNGCEYCLAAHTVLGQGAGLTEEETRDARRATSQNERERVALEFARKVVQDRGVVTDTDVAQLRRAEYTDGQIVEVVATVALNLFTNYFNHVAGTEVDFPTAPSLSTEQAAHCDS